MQTSLVENPSVAQLDETLNFLRTKYSGPAPVLGVVLGSGLSGVANAIDNKIAVPYAEIPHFVRSTVAGHAGQLLFGTLEGVPVVCMQGRFHLYEGYTAKQATYPICVMKKLGCKAVIVSNAAGCLNTSWRVGDIMLIADHINLQGQNPLIGPNPRACATSPEQCARFPDMSNCYDKELRDIVTRVASSQGTNTREGVYVALSGPSYETAAEHRFLRIIGADCVGMSTVCEVIVARHIGMKVVGLSVQTNMCMPGVATCHEEVIEAGNKAGRAMVELVKASARPILASLEKN
ncbi:putative Purine nucleoside phosphorylase 1 [Paratrimastix pyriformis]|uniref:Purine nucleoside phosphorylase n=1 Tax=Paratrimastix pyriformis TaxID=342808 RepID=A0ABQ8UR69_9EUKA|nr:putative Purine nucleoside phosphorylase 1 [Paratrimastix pyriformis]|eukprot:GAFH01002506.1.p1 GENE.GAFH01002506.1~~GAFH01002506.1.p1  ORF type:complete len:292 (-),score=89.10 GAFH01002506.1:236-1111(-)